MLEGLFEGVELNFILKQDIRISAVIQQWNQSCYLGSYLQVTIQLLKSDNILKFSCLKLNAFQGLSNEFTFHLISFYIRLLPCLNTMFVWCLSAGFTVFWLLTAGAAWCAVTAVVTGLPGLGGATARLAGATPVSPHLHLQPGRFLPVTGGSNQNNNFRYT